MVIGTENLTFSVKNQKEASFYENVSGGNQGNPLHDGSVNNFSHIYKGTPME